VVNVLHAKLELPQSLVITNAHLVVLDVLLAVMLTPVLLAQSITIYQEAHAYLAVMVSTPLLDQPQMFAQLVMMLSIAKLALLQLKENVPSVMMVSVLFQESAKNVRTQIVTLALDLQPAHVLLVMLDLP